MAFCNIYYKNVSIYFVGCEFAMYICPINNKQKHEIMKKPITIELYESPQLESNLEKFGHMSQQCVCCGKPMKEGETKRVHMNEHWLAVDPEIVNTDNCFELTGANSQGAFPIGNSCAKKMKGYTFEGIQILIK